MTCPDISAAQEDSCYATNNPHSEAFKQYALMRDALNKTGRHIFFSLCGWSTWYAEVGTHIGNGWRIETDVVDWLTVYRAVRANEKLGRFAVSHVILCVGSVPA